LRLKSELWIKAHLRRCLAEGLFGAVTRKGSPEAGTIFVIVNKLDGTGLLFGPPPGSAYDDDGRRLWRRETPSPEPLAAIQAKLEKQIKFDPDIWILEIEDREGAGFLEAQRE
jgi:hypothetical protein